MLFHGIACFSPSVHASLRAVWVKHGGSLTHSKEDFLQASVFFCDGPHDPWLKESAFRAASRPALSPSASRTLVSIQPPVALPSPVLPITVFPACTTRTKSYPSPANSSPIKTPNPKPNPRASKPVDPGVRRIDFTTLKATPALPVLTLPCSRPGRPRTRKHCNNRTHDTLLEPVEHVASGPPRTSIAELLRAPRAEACVFDVSETYRAKVFTCLKVPKPSTCSGTAQPPVLKYDTAPL
ncbi:hypothetical protein FB451DRAFT_1499676 [Mycena latifolia]|nr:hypothetical protein FB451DRAFT_1499676 [Mycena latifolia]